MSMKRNLKQATIGIWLLLFVLQLASCQVEQYLTGRIAFISFRDGNADIYVMDADGHNETQLTFNPNDDHSPTWSSDGSRIAFVSKGVGYGDIYVINADGTQLTRLTSDPGEDRRPVWSPDGKCIAFISDRSGSDEVCTMSVDGTNQVCYASSNPAVKSGELAWSPDSTSIAYTSLHSIENCEPSESGTGCTHRLITVMHIDKPNQPGLIHSTFNNRTGEPNWSPDGKHIVFYAFPGVAIMNFDATNPTMIYEDEGLAMRPTWSPDGELVAFLICSPSGSAKVYTMNPDGTNLTPLARGAADCDWWANSRFSWSPDGQYIVFAGDFNGTSELREGIYVVDVDTGERKRLTNSTDGNPVWSPQ